MKMLMWAIPAALIWLLMSVTPAQAYGEPWDWCSSVTVNSNGAKNVAAVSVSGNCDGGRLRLTGSLQRGNDEGPRFRHAGLRHVPKTNSSDHQLSSRVG
ncbi:MAG: hypothetical protein JW384_00589 [Nitrosomonadaceae bacterium]|nr:hypothetical protein [Nitrosomonadaceae bacterium]